MDVEASQLQLPPGHWPKKLTYQGCDFTFVKFSIVNNESAKYQSNNTILTVWND